MHDVVVIAVRNAVSAATITFTATSMIFFFIYVFFCVKFLNAEVPKSLYRGPLLVEGRLRDIVWVFGLRRYSPPLLGERPFLYYSPPLLGERSLLYYSPPLLGERSLLYYSPPL